MFTGLPTLYNHNVVGSYPDLSGISAAPLYCGRVLACSRPGDVVQLPETLYEPYGAVSMHYRRMGLCLTEAIEWTLDYTVARKYPDHYHSVFIFGPQAHQVRPNRRRLGAVRGLNSKNWFIRWCQRHDVPVPQTQIYQRGQTPTQAFDGPWLVKGDVAASGTRVVQCGTWQDVLAAAGAMDQDFQVQASVPAAAFLNVQYLVHSNGVVSFVETTVQELDGVAHAGNIFPAPYKPRRLTDSLAASVARLGVEGVIAFDVAVVLADNRVSYSVLECNPRPNGASYFTAVARRLRLSQWVGCNEIATNMTLSDLLWVVQAEGLEYLPGSGGVVVVNWGTVLDGKIGVLFAGTSAKIEADRQALSELVRPVT